MCDGGPLLVSAPGKVIVTGEHAVVYGQPALVAALQLRTYTQVLPAPHVRLSIPALQIDHRWSEHDVKARPHLRENSALDMSARAFLQLYGELCEEAGYRGMEVTVKSELIVGAGLGSSASYSVSLSAALLLAFGKIRELDRSSLRLINEHGYKLETLFHGRPSGADNTTCCLGGVRRFVVGGQDEAVVEEVELTVCVVDTAVPRSTKTMVDGVRRKHQTDDLSSSLSAIGAISEQTLKLLRTINEHESEVAHRQLSQLVERNQELLRCLGVSHERIERVLELGKELGLSGKLTGAGGGGCVFLVLPPDFTSRQEMMERIRGEFKTCFQCQLGGQGVRIEDSTVWSALQ